MTVYIAYADPHNRITHPINDMGIKNIPFLLNQGCFMVD
jgi:hypothetical protein